MSLRSRLRNTTLARFYSVSIDDRIEDAERTILTSGAIACVAGAFALGFTGSGYFASGWLEVAVTGCSGLVFFGECLRLGWLLSDKRADEEDRRAIVEMSEADEPKSLAA